jgi:hypothetical protein
MPGRVKVREVTLVEARYRVRRGEWRSRQQCMLRLECGHVVFRDGHEGRWVLRMRRDEDGERMYYGTTLCEECP